MSELDFYDYELPPELIAQQPLEKRDRARLMQIRRKSQSIEHRHVYDLPDILRPADTLVLNQTKVVPARLIGYRTATGGGWEGLFLDVQPDGTWSILSRTRGKLQAGETVTLQSAEGNEPFSLRLLEKREGGIWQVQPEAEAESAFTLLEQVGRVPLPHYIRDGQMEEADYQRYQTVYAQTPGAVAAPTAGLHFTDGLLERIQARGITLAKVTLHVGLGTFRPIAADSLQGHEMHAEWGEISAPTCEQLNACRAAGGRIIAVGTTCVRVLETAASSGELKPWHGWTDLFIRPPYSFRAVDALMTNFHLPRSTLLVLVHAFGGSALMQRAYQQAVEQRYRFYSYGDCMLIE